MASLSQEDASTSDKQCESTTPKQQEGVSERDEGYSEEYKALHTMGIYKDRPPFLDPKGEEGMPYGPPPIQQWADKLMGKRLIAKDADGDDTVLSSDTTPC